MKKIAKPGFLISDQVSNIVKAKVDEHCEEIDPEDFDFVTPRVFPNGKVPVRVTINRKMK